MRIPFLVKRKKAPTLFQKGIEDEFSLNEQAKKYTEDLFYGVKADAEMKLNFIFEQLYVTRTLADQHGSILTASKAKDALIALRLELNELSEFQGSTFIIDATSSVCINRALNSGRNLLQELPRSEFKLAYVNARRLVDAGNIQNYLKDI